MHIVRKEVQFYLPHFFQFSKNFEYKIDHISKNENQKIDFLFVSEHCASFGTKKNCTFLVSYFSQNT